LVCKFGGVLGVRVVEMQSDEEGADCGEEQEAEESDDAVECG